METTDNGRSFQAVSGFARRADQATGINETRVSGMDQRPLAVLDGVERSEEHTSELQSLMRISYAVFCLKKKKQHKKTQKNRNHQLYMINQLQHTHRIHEHDNKK